MKKLFNAPDSVAASLRYLLACGLILTGLLLITWGWQKPTQVYAACTGDNLYLGSYYLMPDDGSHLDFEQVLERLQDVPGQFQPNLAGGVPVPTAPNPPLNSLGNPTNTSIRQFDWYTSPYQIFTRLDNNPLQFSNDGTPGTRPYFGPSTNPPASAALPANKDLFAVHWHANIVIPAGGLTIPYSFALDDAGWVFVDGQLRIDHGGIHPPATFTGSFNISGGSHVVDVFYADRHTVNAVTNFQLTNLSALLDCGSPNLNLTKSVTPTGPVNPGELLTYTIQIANSGNFTATDVLVRDTTPANTSFVSTSRAPVSGPTVGGSGELVWNVGTLLPGQTTSLSFVVQVNANTPPAIAISNAAEATSTESGGVRFKSNSVTNLVKAAAVLTLDKQAAPPPGSSLNIGDTITYTLKASNPGNVATGSVVVEDNLPLGLNFVSANPPATLTGNKVRWTLPPLAPLSSQNLTLVARVINRPAGGLVQNRATASSNGVTASSPLVSHNINNASDTSINKIGAFASPLVPGSLITYTLTAANAGPSTAVNVVVSDTLPAPLLYLGSVPTATTFTGGVLTWNLGDFAPGTTRNIVVSAQVPLTYTGTLAFTNQANIRSDTPEIEPANNTAEADVPGAAAPVDASVVKTGPPVIAPGQVFIYTLRVTTVAGGDNIVVTDTLPTGLTLVPEQTSPPALGSGPTYYWNLGRMNPGTSRVIQLAVRASGVTPGTSITNSAEVTGGRGPVRPPSGGSNTNTRVENGSDLEITKATTSDTFRPGSTVNFSITVRNNSPTNTSGAFTVTDALAPGLRLQTSTPPPDTSDIVGDVQTLVWRGTTVPAGGTVVLNFTVLVPTSFSAAFVSNAARLQSSLPVGDPDITSSPVQIPRFDLAANLVLTKDTTLAAARRGQAFAYTIAVVNNGPIEARAVTVQDLLPAGLTYISSDPAPTSLSPLTWNVGNLPAGGGRAAITLIVQLDVSFSGAAVSNSASVTTLSANSNAANNTVVNRLPISAPPASATPALTAVVGPTSTPSDTPTPTVADTPSLTPVVTITPETSPVTDTPAITPGDTTTPTPTEDTTVPTVEVMPGPPDSLPSLPNTGQGKAKPSSPDNGGQGLIIGLGLILLIAGGVLAWRTRRL